MSAAKNDWIESEAGRKHFFGSIKDMGISADEAKEALGVSSMKDVPMGVDETLAVLKEWDQATRGNAAESPPEQAAQAPPEVAETATDTAIATTDKPDISLPEWRSREDIDLMGSRIKSLLPGGDKLSTAEARSLAQYSLAMGANPFRGEVYAYSDYQGFHIVEGYKLLVRWAQRQCPYTEDYEPLELTGGDIGFRCRILRDDRAMRLQDFINMGADWKEAYRLVSIYADGVVTKADMTAKSGKAMDPPKGWTWEQVARKRALKNALNLSHGAPSLKEIAQESWMVGDTETAAQDWEVASEHPQKAQEPVAQLSANTRDWDLQFQSLSDEEKQALFEQNKAILRGTEEERDGTLL